ncbi:MAG: transketolase, transketolase [Candidatus Taylorbacteria bacterium]|nr:transketolase, transketolase [Candidatus Taylorbacteria bacterium]
MEHLTEEKLEFLKAKANNIRESIIEMLLAAGSGHTAGPLGMSDIFSTLFFHILKHDPKNPEWKDRDRLVLSNGHICPVYYAALAHSGYFPLEELKTLRKFGSRLQGHPHREFLPILENSSGPLGSGLSQAVGMAIAERMDDKASAKKFFCLTGDGELDEGQNWEALMLAGKEKLHNLIMIVDRNNIQIDGFTDDIMPLSPLDKRLESFGFEVQTIDGNDMKAIVEAVEKAYQVTDKPSVIIAKTVPGKGVKEFEGKYEFHGYMHNKEEGVMALKELRTLGGKIKAEHQ